MYTQELSEYTAGVEKEEVAEKMMRESKWNAKIRPGIDVPTMKLPLKARNLTPKHVQGIEKTLISEEKGPMDLILVNEAFDITDKNIPSRVIRECKLENVNSDSLYRIQLYLKNVIEKLGHKLMPNDAYALIQSLNTEPMGEWRRLRQK
jgi:hypothetical protein